MIKAGIIAVHAEGGGGGCAHLSSALTVLCGPTHTHTPTKCYHNRAIVCGGQARGGMAERGGEQVLGGEINRDRQRKWKELGFLRDRP